jgi:hypothetical protein
MAVSLADLYYHSYNIQFRWRGFIGEVKAEN